MGHNSVFNFLKNYILFFAVAELICIPTSNKQEFQFVHIPANICYFLYCSHPNGCRRSHCGSNLHLSLVISETNNFFHDCWHLYIFGEIIFKLIAHF